MARFFALILLVFYSKFIFAKTNQDFIVANVNNQAITYFEVIDRFNYITYFSKFRTNSKEEKDIVMNQIIDKMVNEELIRQEGKRMGLEVPENELKSVISAIADKKKQNYSQFKQSFNKNNISFSNYERQIEADLIWSKIISQALRSKIKVDDHQINEFLEQNHIETKLSKFLIAEIFIPKGNDAKELSQKIYEELINKGDFEDFVKQFSQSPSSQNDGKIGWVSQNDIDKKLYEAIKNLAKNQYSKPIFLTDGYYIFKILDKKISNQIKDEDRKNAYNRLFMKQLETASRAYLMELKKNSFIEIYYKRVL